MRRLPHLRGRLTVSPLIARARVSPLLAQARVSPLLAQARLSPLMAIILGAAAFATLLSALFALYGLFGPTGAGTEAAAPDWKAPTLAIVELDPPKPASADVQTLTRPIFSKTRKPTPRSAPHAEAVVTSSAPSGVTVSAIVRKGKTVQAFVVSPDAPEGAWKKIGDSLDSWTISDIGSDALTLRSGGNAATVKLYSDAPADEPPPGAPGALPPPGFGPQAIPAPPPPGAPAPPPPPPPP